MTCSRPQRTATRPCLEPGTPGSVVRDANAPVICIHGLLGAGDTRDKAGLKCRDFTSNVSRQCLGCAEVLISRLNSLHSLTSFCFRCLDNLLKTQTCKILNLVSVAEHASLNRYGLQNPKNRRTHEVSHVCINI